MNQEPLGGEIPQGPMVADSVVGLLSGFEVAVKFGDRE